MATVVRKGTRAVPNGCVEEPSATWDWRVPAWRGDTDAATARAARERQTAWRRDHPAAWRAQLERLVHFEPAYRYDPTHEYTDDWTTDPDYGADVHRLDYDEDGFVCSPHHRHTPCLMALLDVLADLLGNRVEHEAELHFPARSTGQSQVVPDLMVLPPACELPAGMERNKEGRTVRLDEGHPLPELVAEIVSPTSEVRDLEDKLALYAALGIVEYLACYPGDLPDPDAGEPGSPAELRLFPPQPGRDVSAGDGRSSLLQPRVRHTGAPVAAGCAEDGALPVVGRSPGPLARPRGRRRAHAGGRTGPARSETAGNPYGKSEGRRGPRRSEDGCCRTAQLPARTAHTESRPGCRPLVQARSAGGRDGPHPRGAGDTARVAVPADAGHTRRAR